jgi:hypothetical protein
MQIEKFKSMIGVTMKSVEVNTQQDEMVFTSTDGKKYKFLHYQDCCEHVYIEDIEGDIKDLEGAPILIAEEVSSESADEFGESCTWTFYKFATNKGHVTVRWLGESNGFYSESVDFEGPQ